MAVLRAAMASLSKENAWCRRYRICRLLAHNEPARQGPGSTIEASEVFRPCRLARVHLYQSYLVASQRLVCHCRRR